jgi:hypothetical protein
MLSIRTTGTFFHPVDPAVFVFLPRNSTLVLTNRSNFFLFPVSLGGGWSLSILPYESSSSLSVSVIGPSYYTMDTMHGTYIYIHTWYNTVMGTERVVRTPFGGVIVDGSVLYFFAIRTNYSDPAIYNTYDVHTYYKM